MPPTLRQVICAEALKPVNKSEYIFVYARFSSLQKVHHARVPLPVRLGI